MTANIVERLKRQLAIEKYARIKLTELSPKERAEQLDIMTLEDWTDVDDWSSLPESIQEEFSNVDEIKNPQSKKYDPILLIWLKESLQHLSNEFLCSKLNIENIIGEAIQLESCPCCGFRTIAERGNYNICKVCWWEDDGQDNEYSPEEKSGPNYGISLVLGRFNYIMYGLYDPNRTDLIKLKAETEMYKIGRIFKIIDKKFLIEDGTNWKWEINLDKNN